MKENSHPASMWRASYHFVLYERHLSLLSYFLAEIDKMTEFYFLK